MTNPMDQVTGFMPEMQDITRQRELAKMLIQQSQQPLQGQMVGNRYVGASPWEGIANLYSGYKANQLAKEADTKQAQLAELIRKGTAEDMIKFNELRYGKQGVADVVPEGQTLRDDQGQLTMGAQQGVAPVVANPAEAYKFALQSRFPQVSNQAYEMLKPQKLGAEESLVVFNPMTGKQETVMKGTDKFHAPIQVDAGNLIQLRDPKNPTQVIATIPKSKLGGNTLPEGATKQVTGSVNMVDAINNYQTVLNKYNGMALTPSNRADLSNAYNNMMLQAKEAYNLGVLNGPDYQILQSVVQDPNSFKGTVVDTKALIGQSNALGKTAENTINNAYGVHNVEVPAYVKSKVQQLPHNQQTKTAPSIPMPNQAKPTNTGSPKLVWDIQTGTWK